MTKHKMLKTIENLDDNNKASVLDGLLGSKSLFFVQRNDLDDVHRRYSDGGMFNILCRGSWVHTRDAQFWLDLFFLDMHDYVDDVTPFRECLLYKMWRCKDLNDPVKAKAYCFDEIVKAWKSGDSKDIWHLDDVILPLKMPVEELLVKMELEGYIS